MDVSALLKSIKDKLAHNKAIRQAYESRWVWYHTILALELLILIVIQIATLAKL